MRSFITLALAISSAYGLPTLVKRADPLGIDVSNYQTDVNWNSVASSGVVFAYIKATEGTSKD